MEDLGLRACDGVHLTGADYLRASAAAEVTFACFDEQLNRAARTLELRILSDG